MNQHEIEILNAIRSYHKEHGLPPSMRDIAARVTFSRNVVHKHLRLMRDAGLIQYEDRLARTVRIVKVIVA